MNLFISQPMNGKSDQEIKKVKEIAIDEVRNMFGEDVKVIDSFIKENPPQDLPDDAKAVWYLGKSILLMTKADIIYFAKGWREARACVLENAIAIAYNMCCIQTN